MVAQVRRAAAMSDDHMLLGRRSSESENLELFAAHRAVVGMRSDGRAGLEMRAGGGAQALLLIHSVILSLEVAHLMTPALTPLRAIPSVSSATIDVGDLAERALLKVGGVAEVFLVEPVAQIS